MKILIIRHGDPDYSRDSLTEKGWREAEYLSEKLSKMGITYSYVSPLGRAKDTASFTLQKLGQTAEEKEWLREFVAPIHRPDVADGRIIPWDWLPQDWMQDERFFQFDHWYENERMQEANVKKEYDWVVQGFDEVLARHGYVRDGHFYRAEKANNDTIAFFCHFGLGSILTSYLLSVSPMVIWHGACAAPSSVTTFVTEERRKGIASFRMSSFGDISHLYAHGEEPAFAARFCECYDNADQRHD
ncbi:MAG: phosphoglycerate mutase family protein [Blautia sp.]|nr:phosphoglycerate mutase family protein [Blautia sp.]MDY5030564.1 histidine phosphatase family protein [Blautia sp.]